MTCDDSPHATTHGPRYARGMRTTLLSLVCLALLASCSSGPATDISDEFQTDVCAVHTSAGSAFTAATSTGTAVMHQLSSGDTPNAVALPAGAPGYVGFHVSEMHTTMMVLVKQAADMGAVTRGGAPSDIVFDMGPVPASFGCSDLYYYKLHADTPGDY